MLIKEYRIPLPLTVEEYRIAQLYMIQVSQHIIRSTASFQGSIWIPKISPLEDLGMSKAIGQRIVISIIVDDP